MRYFAGIDVSLEASSVCMVDAEGRLVREAKVPSEPEALVAVLGGLRAGFRAVKTDCRDPRGIAISSDGSDRFVQDCFRQ